jgi:hypothetical protein
MTGTCALQVYNDSDEDDVLMFLGQLAALAGSSMAGAIQTTFGKLASNLSRSIEYDSQGQVVRDEMVHQATHLMLSRFERPAQIRGFLELPPCLALVDQEEDTVPVKAAQSLQIVIVPAESANNSQPLSHRLPKTS